MCNIHGLPIQEPQLAFYGDALVETWRGTQHGAECPRCKDAASVFDAHFGHDYNRHSWGIAGMGFHTAAQLSTPGHSVI